MDKPKAVTVFAVPLLLFLLLYFFIAPEFREIPASLRVGEVIGFDVNTTALTFGTVYLNGASQREMVISNEDSYDKLAHFTAEGGISTFLVLPEDLLVRANTNTSVMMRAEVPFGAPLGNYTGKVIVFLRRAI